MLSYIPAAVQAIVWPLAGATLVVALNRLLPNWLSRLLTLAASIASLVALFSLNGQASGAFQGTWEPFTFLRTSPALQPTPLGLVTGIVLAGWSAVSALGIRGSQHPKAALYGLNLVILAGGVVMALAGNLLTIALGSALLDMALVVVAVSAVSGAGQGQRVSFRICVPGLISTGLLLLAALRTDTDSGTLSLFAVVFSPQVLALLAAAGLFRLAVFPLHPRGLSAPEQATSLVLSMGAGVFLLARAQALGGSPAGTLWFLAIGAIALVAGGWLAWSAGSPRSEAGGWPAMWSALAIQQAGIAVLFTFLFPGAAPWPLVCLVLAPGLLVLWWDASRVDAPGPASAWIEWVRRQGALLKGRLRTLASRLPIKHTGSLQGDGLPDEHDSEAIPKQSRLRDGWSRLRNSRLGRRGATLLPALALGSLAGMPLTVGAVTRWHLYGALLAGAHPLLLAALWASDAFLAGGLILAGRGIVRKADARPRWSAVAGMVVLAAFSTLLWLAPRFLSTNVGLPALPGAGVSAWGIGILFVLPWLVGAWLAKIAGSVAGVLGRVRRVASLERAARPAEWLGRGLLTAVYWLGSVGEGEGWWGWALVVLALGALYLAAR